MSEKLKDTRYVYSRHCTWHGPIQEVALIPYDYVVNGKQLSLPGCPHCGSTLMEYDSRAKWDSQAAKFAEKENQPRYAEWLESLRVGHCIPVKDWDWRKSLADFLETHPA
jgi:hypothetical protein